MRTMSDRVEPVVAGGGGGDSSHADGAPLGSLRGQYEKNGETPATPADNDARVGHTIPDSRGNGHDGVRAGAREDREKGAGAAGSLRVAEGGAMRASANSAPNHGKTVGFDVGHEEGGEASAATSSSPEARDPLTAPKSLNFPAMMGGTSTGRPLHQIDKEQERFTRSADYIPSVRPSTEPIRAHWNRQLAELEVPELPPEVC